MERLIDKGQLSERLNTLYEISSLGDEYNQGWRDAIEAVFSEIDDMPTGGRESGHWIFGLIKTHIVLEDCKEQMETLGYVHRNYINIRCSKCRKVTIVDSSVRYTYCPHCGADMHKETFTYYG